jgi:hypothetical protein
MNTEQTSQEWTPEGGVQIKPPAHLRLATFRDEQGEGDYHLAVPVTGGMVYVREMDDETFKVFCDRQKEFIALQEKPLRAELKAQELQAQNRLEEATKLRLEAIEMSLKAKEENYAFTRWLLEKLVAGWSFPRPYTPDAFAQLRSEDHQLVVGEIVRASDLNRSDADFLAVASSPT